MLRIVGAFLAASSLFGLLMFWSTNHPAAAGVPLSLLLMSLISASRIKAHPLMLIIAIVLVILSYALAGIPFLNTQDDTVARLLHFIELLLICILIFRSVTIRKEQRNKKADSLL